MSKVLPASDFPKLLPPISQVNKKKNWDLVEGYINHITDGLGLPVDKGIKKPVTALNLLGFRTEQSCEGHLDRSLAPWIRLEREETEEIKKLDQTAEKLYDEIQQLRQTHDIRSPKVLSLYEKYHEINRKRREPSVKKCQKILDLLCDFYKDRIVREDIHLVISSIGRIEPIGFDFLEIQSPEIKEKKLKEYQEEMAAFGDFLANKYFT